MIDLWAIDDLDLDVYQFRMLVHIARVGVCWKSIRTLANDCNMSIGKASQVKQWLLDNGHIKTTVDKITGNEGVAIADNYHRSPDERNVHHMNADNEQCSPHEHECSPDEQRCSPHEPKTITIRQEQKNSGNDDETVTAVKQLVTVFTEKTGIFPSQSDWHDGWQAPLENILGRSDDVEMAVSKIEAAVDILRERNYKIKNPMSLTTTIANLNGSVGTPKVLKVGSR